MNLISYKLVCNMLILCLSVLLMPPPPPAGKEKKTNTIIK